MQIARVECDTCGAIQPADWQPGDVCYNCGAHTQPYTRCGWCCHSVPDQKFCRNCGFEMVSPDRFPVARMLKAAQVDMLSLPAKVREMPEEQAAHFRSIFARDHDLLQLRVEELRLAEEALLHKTYSRDLEIEFVDKLPANDENKALLKRGPEAPLTGRPDRLAEVAASSPFAETQRLAGLAVLLHPDLMTSPDVLKNGVTTLSQAVAMPDLSVRDASEYLAALSHWRLLPLLMASRGHFARGWLPPRLEATLAALAEKIFSGLSSHEKMHVSPVLSRVQTGNAALDEAIEAARQSALTSADKQLKFAAALAGGEGALILQEIERRAYEPEAPYVEEVGQFAIALHKTPQLADILDLDKLDAAETSIEAALTSPKPGFPPFLNEPVIAVLEASSKPMLRDLILKTVKNTPVADAAERALIKRAEKTSDGSVLTGLMTSMGEPSKPLLDTLMRLPLSEDIARSINTAVSSRIALGELWMTHLWVSFKAEEPMSSLQQSLKSVLAAVLQNGEEDAFFALKGMLQDLMETPDVWPLIKQIMVSNFQASYRVPATDTQTDFAPTLEQFTTLFKGERPDLKRFAISVKSLNPDAQGDLIRYFWAPFKSDWEALYLADPFILPPIVDTLLAITENAEIWGTTRADTLKSAIAFMDHLPEEAQKNAAIERIKNLPHEGDFNYLIERFK